MGCSHFSSCGVLPISSVQTLTLFLLLNLSWVTWPGSFYLLLSLPWRTMLDARCQQRQIERSTKINISNMNLISHICHDDECYVM